MKNLKSVKIAIALMFGAVLSTSIAILYAPIAYASDYVGTIKGLRFSDPGNSRLSIKTDARSTTCTGGGAERWYAYDRADTGWGKVWTAGVIAAYMAGKQVIIYGNNTCDRYGVEGIRLFDM